MASQKATPGRGLTAAELQLAIAELRARLAGARVSDVALSVAWAALLQFVL